MNRPAQTRERDNVFPRRVFLVAGVAVLVLLAWAVRHVLLLAFASVLVAVGLDAMARAVSSRTPLSRAWALALSAAFVVALIAGIVLLFGAQVGAQIRELLTRIPEAWNDLLELLSGAPWGADLIRQMQESVASQGAEGALGALGRVGGWTLSLAGAALDAFLMAIGSIFLAADPRPYRKGLLRLFPGRMQSEVSEAMDDAGRSLERWLLGTLVSMAAVSAMVGIALWLLGVPAFLALALIAGLSQFLPLIGPLLASVPAILLGLTVSPLTPVWVALSYFAITTFEANLLTPMIQKKAVSLQPALMLFAILAAGLLLGPLGALLAVPLTVVIVVFVARFYVNGALDEDGTQPGGRNSTARGPDG
jgi:predicted PurR-regulated permease PerM